MNKDIAVYEHPNPHMKSFFISAPLWPLRVEIFRKPLPEISGEKMKSLGNIGGRVIQELLEIAGVRELWTRPREILVKKERAASWQDIEPGVLEILRRALRKQRIHLVKR
jgi:hypothetical protein